MQDIACFEADACEVAALTTHAGAEFVPKRMDRDRLAATKTRGDEDKAISLVDERMLRIGVVGQPKDVIERLEPLVAAGARHLSFGPPLGPDVMEAVRLLGQVVTHFRGAN